MSEATVSSPQGTEISERSSELPLPATGLARRRYAPSDSASGRESVVSEADLTSQERARLGLSPRPPRAEAAHPGLRGKALPGDRGPANQDEQGQRPSFWRRIALGRRTPSFEARTAPETREWAPATETDSEQPPPANPPDRARASVERAPGRPPELSVTPSQAVERRIVEPLLQALVSVESKLERSHTDLLGRSDQVEERLTQLWDIEEQLGALGEVQESLLRVSERQRRLESAVVAQTRSLRWLIGAVFFSLAAAAFVVAAVLR